MLAACNSTNIARGIFQVCYMGFSGDHAWQGQGQGFAREGYARAYLKIAVRWQDHALNALVNHQT